MKKWLLIAARLLVAMATLYFATRNVDWRELQMLRPGLSLLYLLPAFICYNLSQCISAFRLLKYYHVLQPSLSYNFNLRLYYRAMFYNLFLPGGIGGDAYKVITLKNNSNTYRQLTIATLMDRVTGLGVVLIIITILVSFVPLHGVVEKYFSFFLLLMIIGVPAYYVMVYYFFRPYHRVLPVAFLLSILVQGLQVLGFFFVLFAMGADTGISLAVAFVFLASSVIAALPLSIGGIGTRELAIATGATYFQFPESQMIAASLIFFLVVVISSSAGWMITTASKPKPALKHGPEKETTVFTVNTDDH